PFNGGRDTRCEAGFVPPVSPRFRREHILPERLWSIREAAVQLNLSRASLYKPCAQNEVVHVRFGNRSASCLPISQRSSVRGAGRLDVGIRKSVNAAPILKERRLPMSD